MKRQMFIILSLFCSLFTLGQPGSYTFGFSFDLYHSDSLINSQSSDFDFIWNNKNEEVLTYTDDIRTSHVKYHQSKTFNHCISTYYNSRNYSLLIIKSNSDSMLLHFDFSSTPMDSHFILDKICFEKGTHILKPITYKSCTKISEEKHYINITKISKKICQ